MPPLMGNGEGHTLLILTDAESRLIREWLTNCATCDDPFGKADLPSGRALKAFCAGIARGTAKLAEEFKAEQQRRKGLKNGR